MTTIAAPRPRALAPVAWLRRNNALPLAVGEFFLMGAALTGLGDAPAPNQSAELIARHFQDVAPEVLRSAPYGSFAALAVFAFIVLVAGRLHHRGERTPALWLIAGGSLASGYLLFIQVMYASLASGVAASSPSAAKALFVPTILAVPVFGLGVATTLAAAAYGARRARLLPSWWVVGSAVGAALASVAVVSYADSDYFSPDVQQQVISGVLQLWVLVTGFVLVTGRRA